jgi:hypothetical protein
LVPVQDAKQKIYASIPVEYNKTDNNQPKESEKVWEIGSDFGSLHEIKDSVDF